MLDILHWSYATVCGNNHL